MAGEGREGYVLFTVLRVAAPCCCSMFVRHLRRAVGKMTATESRTHACPTSNAAESLGNTCQQDGVVIMGYTDDWSVVPNNLLYSEEFKNTGFTGQLDTLLRHT